MIKTRLVVIFEPIVATRVSVATLNETCINGYRGMSKQISFPILEITTLLVVLFACVLVVVPGFDEFTTTMLFSQEEYPTQNRSVAGTHGAIQKQSDTFTEMLSDANNSGALKTSDPLDKFDMPLSGMAPSGDDDLEMQEQDLELESQSPMLDTLPAENLALDAALSPVVDDADNELETALDNEFGSLDSQVESSPSARANELKTAYSDRVNEFAVEPDASIVDTEVPGSVSETANGEFDTREFESVRSSESIDMLAQNPIPSQIALSNEQNPRQDTLSQPMDFDGLPKIVNQYGSRKQIQANPHIIRVAESLQADKQLVTNPTYPNGSNLLRNGQNWSAQSGWVRGFAPNSNVESSPRPYQIRTTARPGNVPTNNNDFIPKR